MTTEPTILREAREAAGFMDPDYVAVLAEIELEKLEAAERAEARLSASELDRLALVLGLRVKELLAGQTQASPLALFLRGANETEHRELRSLVNTGVALALGEFVRAVKDIDELEQHLGLPRPSLPCIQLLPVLPDEHPGDHYSRSVRAGLGLGDAPISSMRDLVHRLGVTVVWVSEDHVDREVEGASLVAPRPAILANVLGPERVPWRSRTTIAHELCHLLFDQASQHRRVLVTPHGVKPPPMLFDIEKRAKAFAACFLAPTSGVRSAVGSIDPTSEAAITAVGESFGVGRTTVINRLQDVFKLTDAERRVMEMRPAQTYHGEFDSDEPEEPIGFRGGHLFALVQDALGRAAIAPAQARRYLCVPPTEPLPFPNLPPDVRAPTVSRAELIRRKAQKEVERLYPEKGWLALKASLVADGWSVEFGTHPVGAEHPTVTGSVDLDHAGELVRVRLADDPL